METPDGNLTLIGRNQCDSNYIMTNVGYKVLTNYTFCVVCNTITLETVHERNKSCDVKYSYKYQRRSIAWSYWLTCCSLSIYKFMMPILIKLFIRNIDCKRKYRNIIFMPQWFYGKGTQYRTRNWDSVINLICFFYCFYYHYS